MNTLTRDHPYAPFIAYLQRHTQPLCLREKAFLYLYDQTPVEHLDKVHTLYQEPPRDLLRQCMLLLKPGAMAADFPHRSSADWLHDIQGLLIHFQRYQQGVSASTECLEQTSALAHKLIRLHHQYEQQLAPEDPLRERSAAWRQHTALTLCRQLPGLIRELSLAALVEQDETLHRQMLEDLHHGRLPRPIEAYTDAAFITDADLRHLSQHIQPTHLLGLMAQEHARMQVTATQHRQTLAELLILAFNPERPREILKRELCAAELSDYLARYMDDTVVQTLIETNVALRNLEPALFEQPKISALARAQVLLHDLLLSTEKSSGMLGHQRHKRVLRFAQDTCRRIRQEGLVAPCLQQLDSHSNWSTLTWRFLLGYPEDGNHYGYKSSQALIAEALSPGHRDLFTLPLRDGRLVADAFPAWLKQIEELFSELQPHVVTWQGTYQQQLERVLRHQSDAITVLSIEEMERELL